MPAQLVALSEGPDILLDKPILLIGRHQECDIQIPSRKISRRHCCIAQVNDHLVVRDLCSTNGIRINGNRVNEGDLKSGDELTIGNFRYQVNCNNNGAAKAPVVGRPVENEDEDDPFDSCEEPIPLADPDEPEPQSPIPLLLPENIRLAPLSDSQMNAENNKSPHRNV